MDMIDVVDVAAGGRSNVPTRSGGSDVDGAPDLLEHGAPVRGQAQASDTRLFVQLQVFTECLDVSSVVAAVRRSGMIAAVYVDVNDPRGIGVVVMDEDPAMFTESFRAMLIAAPFSQLTPVPGFTMLGRTYAQGREPDLSDFLLHKVPRNVLNPDNAWAVWYPLRRTGAYNRLTRADQGKIMMEHGMLGRRYGEAGYAVDVRLECHGLDRDDNEFVIGLIGPDLLPLSKLIKDMRATRQTAEFIQAMGPFFVGKAVYQSPIPEPARLLHSG
jgi:chlorite dismutase